MFYGLNKFVKNILPKRLFYRALLIVAIPVIVFQLIITFVFFDSLWIKTNKGMTRALVNEINTFIEVYDDEIYNKDEITDIFSVLYIIFALVFSISFCPNASKLILGFIFECSLI